MLITAKISTPCTRCKNPITTGQKIEWNKGAGSHHIDCGAAASASPAPAATPGRCACGRAITGSYTRCYRCAERAGAVKCGNCGGTPGKRGRYGQYTGGDCQCCRPNCNCYDCRS